MSPRMGSVVDARFGWCGFDGLGGCEARERQGEQHRTCYEVRRKIPKREERGEAGCAGACEAPPPEEEGMSHRAPLSLFS